MPGRDPYSASSPDLPWGREVDASANPFDLRPAVQAVLDSIDSFRAKNPDATPILLMGELHVAPVHQALNQLVMAALKKRGQTVAFGDEMNEALLPMMLKEAWKLDGDDLPEGWDKDLDSKTLALRLAYTTAQLSRRQFQTYLHDENVPVRHLDLPIAGDTALVNGHPSVTAAFKHLNLAPDARVMARSPMGLAARNLHMAGQIRADIERTAPDAYLVAAGKGHVFGEGLWNGPAQYSLASLLGGENVIPVWIADPQNREPFPPSAGQAARNGVMIRGAAYPVFAVASPKEERATLARFDAESGGGVLAGDIQATCEKARREFQAVFGALPPQEPARLGFARAVLDTVQRWVNPDPQARIQSQHNRAEKLRIETLAMLNRA